MAKFKTFFNNLRYLFRYNLKTFIKDTEKNIDDTYYAINHIKYEIEDDLKKMKRVKINPYEETIKKIINNKSSICRFGDGEFALLLEFDIAFQKFSPQLKSRLKEVLSTKDENILIGLPLLYESLDRKSNFSRNYNRKFYGKYNASIFSFLDTTKEYYDSLFAMPYMQDEGGYKIDYEERYNKLKQIWNNKDIVIILGERIFNKIQYNIFDNAKTIEYINAPTTNAFKDYEEIYEKACKLDKNKLIIIILGPTATILAYDLAKAGYQALDLGHCAKSYDIYKKKLVLDIEGIKQFYMPD